MDSRENYHAYSIESFARWAKFYDPFLSLFRLDRVRETAVEMSGVKLEDKVLDVCTGTGETALKFAGRSRDVTGVDLSEAMLAVARKKVRADRVRFLKMDAAQLAFESGHFDVSSITFGLHDMPKEVRETVLREMARVTRRRVVIIEYRPPDIPLLRNLYIVLVSLYESKYFPEFCRGRLEDLLERAGLRAEAKSKAWFGLLQIWSCSPVGKAPRP